MIVELLTYFGFCGLIRFSKSTQGKNCPNKYGVYYDGNGDTRVAKTGKKVYRTQNNITGDYVYKYVNGTGTFCNIDEIDAEERRQKAKKKNMIFYMRQSDNGDRIHMLGCDDVKGDRYCEVDKTIPGKIPEVYVKRRIIYNFDNNKSYMGEFYMDTLKFLYVPTDETIREDKRTLREQGKDPSDFREYEDLYEKIIKEWNLGKQRNYIGESEGLYYLGYDKKSDYSYYERKISRWR